MSALNCFSAKQKQPLSEIGLQAELMLKVLIERKESCSTRTVEKISEKLSAEILLSTSMRKKGYIEKVESHWKSSET